jgi:hypothetical protein
MEEARAYPALGQEMPFFKISLGPDVTVWKQISTCEHRLIMYVKPGVMPCCQLAIKLNIN